MAQHRRHGDRACAQWAAHDILRLFTNIEGGRTAGRRRTFSGTAVQLARDAVLHS